MSDTATSSKKNPGRPRAEFSWPEGQFTVDSLHKTTGLSRVTLYLKFKEAEKNHVIQRNGTETTKQGRPRILFTVVKIDAPVVVATPVAA